MKVSELVVLFNGIMEKYGDLPVRCVYPIDPDYGEDDLVPDMISLDKSNGRTTLMIGQGQDTFAERFEHGVEL